MVLQAAQSTKELFQEPLTYGKINEVICILVPRSYIDLTYSSYYTYDTLASGRRYTMSKVYPVVTLTIHMQYRYYVVISTLN